MVTYLKRDNKVFLELNFGLGKIKFVKIFIQINHGLLYGAANTQSKTKVRTVAKFRIFLQRARLINKEKESAKQLFAFFEW